jgi:DNA-binding MarR family transcriptional regulator
LSFDQSESTRFSVKENPTQAFLDFFVNQVYNNNDGEGDYMKKYEKIIQLYFKSIKEFNEFESAPRDFGTGDLLYSSEIHTLQAIGNNENINLSELAEILGISKSGVSKFIKKLLSKKMITKSNPLNNRKEVVFNLTKKGWTAYLGHQNFSEQTFNSIYNILSRLDDQQILFLETFLHELTSEITKINKTSNN